MASTQGKSVSVQWRESGNEFYRNAAKEGVSATLQISRLQQAVNHYDRALTLAQDDRNVERSSAHKNIAMANWKLATAGMAEMSVGKKNVSFYFNQALKNFQEAKHHGIARNFDWHDSLTTSTASCWIDIHEWVQGLGFEERVRELEQLVLLSFDDYTSAHEYYAIAEIYFHQSLTFLADRDYQRSLRCLAECHFPLNEAMRYGRWDTTLLRECALLEEDINVQCSVAESIQARIRGEELLEYVIRDEEVLNIDMVWEGVDWFSRAAMLTRTRDLELEAMALSALGKVYDQVLMMKERAKTCLMKVLELANTMVPRNFSGDAWYEFARSTVERYQQEQVRAEEDKNQKEREEVLKLVKEELDVLKQKHGAMGKLEFLKFLYTTHPPKNPEHKLGEVSATPEWTELKKLYQKAVIHYHPDKVQVTDYGAKWKVLTEEITKLLTSHYEFYKGCDTKSE